MKSKLALAITLWGWVFPLAWYFLYMTEERQNHVFYEINAFSILTFIIPFVYTFIGYLVNEREKTFLLLKRSEENYRSLSQSLQLYKKALETMQLGVTICDLQGNIIYSNMAEAEMHGYAAEELSGQSVRIFAPTDSWHPMSEERIEAMKRWRRESVNWRKDGTEFPVMLMSDVVTDATGKVVSIVTSCEDITERKKSEELIKNILETVDEGFIIVDRNYRILSANKAYARMCRMPLEDIMGRQCYEVSHHVFEPCNMEGHICAIRSVFETGKSNLTEHTHYDSKGYPVYVETRAYPLSVDESGRVITAIETLIDITEHRKTEDQLRHAMKMEAVGTLAGGVAHDFNNVLNVIMGYGTLMLERLRDDQTSKEQLNELLSAADRAANLTKRLLAFSRKQLVEMKPVNINEIILGMEKMLSRIIGEDIVFELELMDREMIVMADSHQIEQVLMNLATNARDAMQKGGRLTIRTGIEELEDVYINAYGYGKPGTYALISVTDTGNGVDLETQQRIFEPFFTTKGIGEGTGLGLSIAYGIIKQHDGYINIYSEKGKGTTFKILLPVIEGETVKKQKFEAGTEIKGGTETILIAEDDASVRRLLKMILESFGYSVIEAEDGEDAIAKYKENSERIQLLILDMLMPKRNGKEVYAEIKNRKPDIKALFVSGYTMDIITKKELLDEEMDFIIKPVSPKDLLKRVREKLDK